MKAIGNKKVKESNDYKEFKQWYNNIKDILHIFSVEQLTELKRELLNTAKGIHIDNTVEELKGLVKVKEMIIMVEYLIDAKNNINNKLNTF